MNRKLILGTIAAAALLGGAAQAAPAVVATGPDGVVISVAPPAPIFEAIPGDREGYVWAPGHYAWRDGRYVWRQGHWIADRPGWEWREARWVQRSDGSWRMVGGGWVRADDDVAYDDGDRDRRERSRRFGPYGDIDRDGIDNQDDRDRDGDGVANRDDDYPNNPNRS